MWSKERELEDREMLNVALQLNGSPLPTEYSTTEEYKSEDATIKRGSRRAKRKADKEAGRISFSQQLRKSFNRSI